MGAGPGRQSARRPRERRHVGGAGGADESGPPARGRSSIVQRHREAITAAAARAWVDYAQSPQFQRLSARLNDMAAAVVDAHGSRQMSSGLLAVRLAVKDWGGALPADPTLDVRQHLAFPLAHLQYDITPEPARDDSARKSPAPKAELVPAPAITLGPERSQAPAPTEAPAPHRDSPKDPQMATPAGPATPDSAEHADPAQPEEFAAVDRPRGGLGRDGGRAGRRRGRVRGCPGGMGGEGPRGQGHGR